MKRMIYIYIMKTTHHYNRKYKGKKKISHYNMLLIIYISKFYMLVRVIFVNKENNNGQNKKS